MNRAKRRIIKRPTVVEVKGYSLMCAFCRRPIHETNKDEYAQVLLHRVIKNFHQSCYDKLAQEVARKLMEEQRRHFSEGEGDACDT